MSLTTCIAHIYPGTRVNKLDLEVMNDESIAHFQVALIILSIKTRPGEQGWCSGESARLPPMCPGFDSRTWRHMWAEFVGSLLCSERFFSGYSGLPLSSKTNI